VAAHWHQRQLVEHPVADAQHHGGSYAELRQGGRAAAAARRGRQVRLVSRRGRRGACGGPARASGLLQRQRQHDVRRRSRRSARRRLAAAARQHARPGSAAAPSVRARATHRCEGAEAACCCLGARGCLLRPAQALQPPPPVERQGAAERPWPPGRRIDHAVKGISASVRQRLVKVKAAAVQRSCLRGSEVRRSGRGLHRAWGILTCRCAC
jgi:hypothetical protein